MPILYVHGVNTRSRDGFLNEIRVYLRRYIAPAISSNPKTVLIDMRTGAMLVSSLRGAAPHVQEVSSYAKAQNRLNLFRPLSEQTSRSCYHVGSLSGPRTSSNQLNQEVLQQVKETRIPSLWRHSTSQRCLPPS